MPRRVRDGKSHVIIGIVNQKGGTGKTTIAINLADALARRNHRVLLVDADPQESVSSWYGVNKKALFEIHPAGDDNVPDIVQSRRRGYDYIIVDGPPSADGGTETILSVSDLAVVPIGPSPLDIWSSRDIMAMIRRTREKRKDFKVRILICKSIVGTRLSKEVRSTLQGFGVEQFRTQISQRIAYIEAMIAGQSVLEYAPQSSAAREVSSLCRETVLSLQ